MIKKAVFTLFVFLLALSAFGQEEIIGFDSERWTLYNAEIVDFLEQKALRGAAILKDVQFENGTIEVDIAFQGSRCFAGLMFRMVSETDYEEIYLRPHQTNNPDALQYTPVFNGLSGWQLYSGQGFTNTVKIPYGEWIHVKMEILGTQARVYIGNSKRPSLVIADLKRGESKGWIGVKGPNSLLAHFANFKYTPTDDLEFKPAPEIETPPGMLMDWELSEPLKITQIDRERYPQKVLDKLEWKTARGEKAGLVDIARTFAKRGQDPDCVLARTTISAEKDQLKRLIFGYSDEVSVFLNGKILFRGNSEYRLRSPRFLGIIGLHDSLFLPLKKGDNELLLMVTENFGGWGFICQLQDVGDKPFIHGENLAKAWETPAQLLTPESALLDKKRKAIYISNYDGLTSGVEGEDAISKISLDGKIEEREWVTGLTDPTGMALLENRLYVAENTSIAEIDPETGKVFKKHPITGAQFLNDMAADSEGNLYITDSTANVIYKFRQGTSEIWLEGKEISRPNGIYIDKGQLLFGNNGDFSLKSVNIQDKTIETVTRFNPGAVIDGIKADGKGNYFVSDWNGLLYVVSPNGEKKEILDTRIARVNIADFEFARELGMLIIPAYYGNRLVCFKVR